MLSIKKFRQIALSFPGTEEQPHFERASFRVKKKIFATLDETKKKATLKFTAIDQSVFCLIDQSAIYPVPNKWGKQGWTIFELAKVNSELMKDALNTAYKTIATASVKKSN